MRNILLRGGPATGKTITARAITYYVGHEGQKLEDVFNNDFYKDRNRIEQYVQSEYVEFIQIHSSMTYEDIVYGMKITPHGSLSMSYAEKRIKTLCDRAAGRKENFFIILDDIDRTNSGKLLGNLLYAIEYRNQAVSLVDGNVLIIPQNVYFIVTEGNSLHSIPIEYAIRRRFDFEKELTPDVNILEKYYSGLPAPTKTTIINVFETIRNFVVGHVENKAIFVADTFIPGHGMFIVKKNGTPDDILKCLQRKFEMQIWQYLLETVKSGFLIVNDTELNTLYQDINNLFVSISVGSSGATSVQKIMINAGKVVLPFSLADSKSYYKNKIIPGGGKEHRTILESIADAIFLNGAIPVEESLTEIFLNTNIVQFEHRTKPGNFASFMVESTQNMNYGYQTKSSNHLRSYYSSNACVTGRWKNQNDAPAYKITRPDGTTTKYIMLNALRNTGFSTTSKVIHADENTASIYCALYLLVKTYLDVYYNKIACMSASNPQLNDLSILIELEKLYWEQKNKDIQGITGADAKLIELVSSCLNLRTLWNPVGTVLEVDAAKFSNLYKGLIQFTASHYEDVYNISGQIKKIAIEGVQAMVDLKDYQHIMDNMGVKQLIFQGPPGTSKTFESKKFVLKQLDANSKVLKELNPSQEDISIALESFRLTDLDYSNPAASSKLVTGGWDLVQFHPSYGYEDFIRGIEVKPIKGTPVYESVNRILGKIAEFAKIAEIKAGDKDAPKFYLIIDEINRANLATVFGELIYGLEYRDSKVSTPYEVIDHIVNAPSKDIVLGKNLYLIGTMNTADKSTDAIDYAIRRRFLFVDSPAQRDVVKNCYQAIMSASDERSIELLLFDAVGLIFNDQRFFNDEYQKNDVRIGHTYFLRNSKTNYKDIISEKFIFQVVPILREYLKDGIVDSFVEKSDLEHQVNQVVAASSDEERIIFLEEEIMMFVKHFGETDSANNVINNQYISDYIEQLCVGMGY